MDRLNGVSHPLAATRAERFEDEKRRIVDSCFNKKDPDGSLQETYITHIRITEYSTYPTSPPPPHARNPEVEKPRVIIVAVRKSGRVRVHKSKENINGSFSIGKSWNLDDLSHIESYTGAQVTSNAREWGAETGFQVTLGKPYFWHAQTEKEKKFFIASLIKIYGKYTGGRVPELSGFDQRELDQVLGAGRRPIAAAPRSQVNEFGANQQSTSAQLSSNLSATVMGLPTHRYQKVQPIRSQQDMSNSPAGSFDSTTSRGRPVPKWTVDSNQSQESIHTKSEDVSNMPPPVHNGLAPSVVTERTEEISDLKELPENATLTPKGEEESNKPPPERRRPPMDPSRPLDRDLVPPPLMSSFKRDPVIPQPKNTDRAASQPPSKTASSELPETHMAESNQTIEKLEINTLSYSNKEGMSATLTSPPFQPDFSANDTIWNDQSSPVLSPATAEDQSRPGLGPMIKPKMSKGDVAGAIWKAASAANAFRPRPGGAGERLRQAQSQSTKGPDGITGVVPAPPRPISQDTPFPGDDSPKDLNQAAEVPDVRISAIKPSRPNSSQELREDSTKATDGRRSHPQTETTFTGLDNRYLQMLAIQPIFLSEKSEAVGKWLDFFGLAPGEQMRGRNIDEMKSDLERELNTAQAGGWLARFRDEDERVDTIKRGIDLAIAECDELDNLLTLYCVELSTLSDDIAYIEEQGQGLQVQTANQKLLKREVESLLETCAITSADLQSLQNAPLESVQGLQEVEGSLITLFRAMSKIDPALNEGGKPANAVLESDPGLGLNSNYSNMRIVQEKKEMYLQESGLFMQRLLAFMTKQFEEAYLRTKQALDGALSKKVDPAHHGVGRELLWRYSPLMLYARDVDLDNWNRLIQVYQEKSSPVYKHEFQSVVAIWRKNARKLKGDELDILFSSQVEKQVEGVANTARKLTVKRSQTLARALRSPLADTSSRVQLDKNTNDARNLPYEVFSGVLGDLLPLVEMEQNFIIDFFHATTLEQTDFADAVTAQEPRNRQGDDLKRHRLMEPDRDLARRVNRAMEAIFAFFESELQRLMEWTVAQDPLQGVGVLAALERKQFEMKQSNQDFLNTILQKLHGALEGKFRKFVDEQLRAIEETKVKINKRKGVISFVRVFPLFLTAIENMLSGLGQGHSVRRTVDSEYVRILKTMFDSLMIIAREHPAAGVAAGNADPEDKEALNFHILLIENMNHFLEETDAHSSEVLDEWKDRANLEYHEHLGLYLDAVMRRPLGKLLDHLENIEAQVQSGKSPLAIARQPSNSQAIFNKVLGSYDAKEIRKGIEVLRKRVEKHFGDADDPTISRSLVVKVLKDCEEFYNVVETRIERVITDVYGGDITFEWPRSDIKVAFR